MKLVYVFHSGFVIEGNDFMCLIDYYRDSKEEKEGVVHELLKKQGKKLYVLVSHGHPDHFNPEVLQWKEKVADIRYVFSQDVRKKLKPEERTDIVFLRKGEGWTDGRIQIKAYGSTDIGISFFIQAEGKKIFHAGDLNNWHWREESTVKESEEYEQNFLHELEDIAKEVPALDLVLFPVDPRLGKDYMCGAIQLMDRIQVKWFAPMHFWEKYDKACALGEYAAPKGVRFIAWTHPGETIEF